MVGLKTEMMLGGLLFRPTYQLEYFSDIGQISRLDDNPLRLTTDDAFVLSSRWEIWFLGSAAASLRSRSSACRHQVSQVMGGVDSMQVPGFVDAHRTEQRRAGHRAWMLGQPSNGHVQTFRRRGVPGRVGSPSLGGTVAGTVGRLSFMRFSRIIRRSIDGPRSARGPKTPDASAGAAGDSRPRPRN